MKIYFNHSLEKKQLKKLLFWFHQRYGYSKTRNLADTLKTMGFHYATYAGISLGVDDLQIPPLKTQLVNNAEEEVLKTDFLYQRGEITSIERFQKVIEAWTWTSENVKEEVLQYFKHYEKLNPVYMMAFSGARGNISQVRQLVGMRGLMSDPQGNLIDVPIKNNFREGLSIIEYVISCYGARKGIVDTALKTANSGYLTRRLVEAAQAVTIYNTDCNTNQGIFISHIKDEEGGVLSSLEERLTGRVLMESIYIQSHIAQKAHPVYWDECVSRYLQDTRERRSEFVSRFNPELRYSTKADMQKVKAIYKNQDIKPLEARIISQYYTQVRIRSPLTCSTNNSKVCQLCYGWNLSQNRIVSLGEAVGIIAAQSIGEPGTQLTMRTFHTGGVFSGDVGQKVVSPFYGYVYISDGYPLQSYESSLSLFGRKVRTQLGENAFFTYTDFYVAISNASLKEEEALVNESYTVDTLQAGECTNKAADMHYALRSNQATQDKRSKQVFNTLTLSCSQIQCKCNIGYNNTKYTDSRITIYTFPSQTLLFVTPGEYVKKKQIIAEVPEKCAISMGHDFSETDAYDVHTKSKKHDSYQATQEFNADNAISTSLTGVYAYANPQSSDAFLHSSVQQENTYEHQSTRECNTAHEEKVEVVSDFSGQVFIQAHEKLGLPSYLASGPISTSSTQQLHTQNNTFWRTAEPMNLWVLSGNKIQVNLSFLRGDKCVTAFSNPPSNSSLFQYKGESTHKSAKTAYSYEIRTSFLRLHTNYAVRSMINTRCNHYAHLFTTPRFNGNGVRTYANSKMINRLKNTLAYHHGNLSTTPGLETYEPNLREKNNLPLYADNYLERRCISQPVLHGKKAVKHKDTQNPWTDAYEDTHNKNYALGSKQINAHFTYLVLDKNIEKQFTLCNDSTENQATRWPGIRQAYTRPREYKIGQLLKKGSVIPQSVHSHSHSSVGLRKNMHNQATQWPGPPCSQIQCNYGKIPETCVITEMQSALHQHEDIAALKAKNENDFNLHIVPSSRLGEYQAFQDISVSLYQPIHGLTGHSSMCVSAHVNDYASRWPGIRQAYTRPRSKFADIKHIRKSLEKLKCSNTLFTDAIIPRTFSCTLHQCTLQSDVSRSQEYSMQATDGVEYPVDDELQLHYASVTGNDALHHISVSESDYEIHSRGLVYAWRIPGHRVACYSQRSRIHGYEDHGYGYCTNPPYADKYKPRAGLLANSRMRIILCHRENTQNEKCITIKTRQVKPYLLSTGASSKLQQWQIVDACEYLFQLPYNREKTGDIVQGLPKIEQFFEARKKLYNNPKTLSVKNFFFFRKKGLSAFISTFLAFRNVQNLCLHSVQRVYQAQGILLSDKHIEIIVRRMTSYVLLLHPGNTSFLPGEIIEYQLLRSLVYAWRIPGHRHLTMSANTSAASAARVSAENPMIFLPYIIGITKVSLSNYRTSFLSAASFQETRRILMNSALEGCIDYLDELKQPVMLGKTIPAGIAFFYEQNSIPLNSP